MRRTCISIIWWACCECQSRTNFFTRNPSVPAATGQATSDESWCVSSYHSGKLPGQPLNRRISMSSTILQLARRSFPPAAAAATATAAAFLSLPVEADNSKEGNAVTNPDGKSSAWTNVITAPRAPPSLEAPNSSLRLFRLSSNVSFSPFFQNAAFCEAPRAKPADGQVPSTPYKPVDPTEPITENPSSFLNSDGQEVKMGGSMWGGGADNDALVSYHSLCDMLLSVTFLLKNSFIFLSIFQILIYKPSTYNPSYSKYHGLFPRRQLWRPSLEYPLWDYNWDGRQPPPIVVSPSGEDGDDESRKSTGDGAKAAEAKRERYIREKGVTRHLILVRHGQYDETHKVRFDL